MVNRRKTTSTGKSKNSGILRTILIVGLSIFVLAAISLSISYFYIKNDRKSAPRISEIDVTKPNPEIEKPIENESKTNQRKSEALALYEGTWVSTANGSMLTLKKDSYLLDFPSVEKKMPLEGHFIVTGNSITFIGSNNEINCGAEPGQYSILIKEKDLILKKSVDKCGKRSNLLEATWFKL